MKLHIIQFITCYFFLAGIGSVAQNYRDSLLQIVTTAPKDSNLVKALHQLSWELRNQNPDTAIILCTQALNQAKELNDDYGTAKSLHQLGVFHRLQGNYSASLHDFSKALAIWENLLKQQPSNSKTTQALGSTLGSLGNICWTQGDYAKALEYFLRALKIDEEFGNKNNIAIMLGNIGSLYFMQNDHSKALEYFFKSLKISKESENKHGISFMLGNIGSVYASQGNYSQALEHFLQALKLDEEIEDKYSLANNLCNIGNLYTTIYVNDSSEKTVSLKLENSTNKYFYHNLLDSALIYQKKAYTIQNEIGDKNGLSSTLIGLGNILSMQRKYHDALLFYSESYFIANTINSLPRKMDSAKKIYETYKKLNISDSSLVWHETFIMYKDSIFNEENHRNLGKQETRFEYEKIMLEQQKEQEKKGELATAEKKQQQIITWSAASGALLMFLLALLAVRGWKNKQKAHMLLSTQNSEITVQKKIIEEKNKDIMDSIYYAKTIQQAMLPFQDRMHKALKEHFILFKPKDIVSGDFYWFMEKDEKIFIAAVDCTGHGVPGAFMSMIGSAILSHIVGEMKMVHADIILNEMHKQVRTALKQEETSNPDGMDIALCVIDKKNAILEYAGANNPLWMIRAEGKLFAENKHIVQSFVHDQWKLYEVKPDKQSIGGMQTEEERVFTRQTIQLSGVLAFYVFSDGYADQFGGPKGKKFKYAQLKELLLSFQDKSMEEQKEILEAVMEKWKGNLEQVDDVCIIGVRVGSTSIFNNECRS